MVKAKQKQWMFWQRKHSTMYEEKDKASTWKPFLVGNGCLKYMGDCARKQNDTVSDDVTSIRGQEEEITDGLREPTRSEEGASRRVKGTLIPMMMRVWMVLHDEDKQDIKQ